jgi:MFS superfamily sulfate permease-like transporter
MINFQDPDTKLPIEDEITSNLRFKIDRKVYNHSTFVIDYPINSYVNYGNFFAYIKSCLNKTCKPNLRCIKSQLFKRIPAFEWLGNYKIKDYLLSDILSGITVAIVHIPQSMAYALLATVSPIYGLYTSFFPVLIYWILGTSRQLSIGTFAVISLMVAETIADLETKYVPPIGFNYTQYLDNIAQNKPNKVNADSFLSLDREKSRIMIMAANAFWIGVIQVAMFFLRFGFITSYLSESLLNGFLTGSAVHVLTSQMKLIFGIKLTSYTGIGKIPKVLQTII